MEDKNYPYHWDKPLVNNKDMFESGAQVLVNTVNCVGAMGKGLALQFKNRYPELNRMYISECNAKQVKPGGCIIHKVNDGHFVANVATKDHWRNPSELKWVIEGVRNLRQDMEGKTSVQFTSVAIPRMGCGLGGLDWGTVRPAIIKELYGCRFDVWLDGVVYNRDKDGINHMRPAVEKGAGQSPWRNEPITEKQMQYIRKAEQNWKGFTGETRGDAADYISSHMRHKAKQVKQELFERE